MSFDFNIRQESFGATLLSLSDGKRKYLTKDELKNIIYHEQYPKDMGITSSKKVKYTKLKANERLLNHLSFADIIYIELTRKCNLHCKHCLNDSGNQLDDELNLNDQIKLIKDMAKCGAGEIRFTGGEPLMNSNIYELIATANSLGIYTSIISNGTLISKSIANKLKELNVTPTKKSQVDVEKLTITPNTKELKAGESVKLNVAYEPTNATKTKITWSTGNKKVATVDENGNVKAIAEGTTKITAKSESGKTITSTITVATDEVEEGNEETNETSNETEEE